MLVLLDDKTVRALHVAQVGQENRHPAGKPAVFSPGHSGVVIDDHVAHAWRQERKITEYRVRKLKIPQQKAFVREKRKGLDLLEESHSRRATRDRVTWKSRQDSHCRWKPPGGKGAAHGLRSGNSRERQMPSGP